MRLLRTGNLGTIARYASNKIRSNKQTKKLIILLIGFSTLHSLTSQHTEKTDLSTSDGEVAELENYLLAPFDKVSIAVFGEPDLAAGQRLTARGEITIPLLGTVEVGGLSVEGAKAKLEELYVSREFLRSPEVFIAIDEFSPKRITILGQVGSPSSFELPMGANYLEIEAAIAMAGGFTDLARRSAIRVTRKDEIDGKERVKEVDMDEILSDEDDGFATSRFRIYPGDILYVPRRYF